MSIQDQYVARLEEILARITSIGSSSEEIQQASDILKKEYLNNSNCIVSFISLIQSSSHANVRQLAAVELSKRIPIYWEEIDPSTKNEVRKFLPDQLLKESEKAPRQSLARVISAIAEIDIAKNEWPNLFEFIVQCINSPNADHREIGVQLLYILLECVNDDLTSSLPQILELLVRTLSDPDSQSVRILSVQAVGKSAEFIDPSVHGELVHLVQGQIPTIVQVLQHAINQGDENGASSIIEVFEDLLLSEVSFLTPHFKELTEFLIQTGYSTNIADGIRIQAYNYLFFALEYKKKAIRKHNLLQPLLDMIMIVATEDDDEEDEEDPDHSTPAGTVLSLLATLTTHFSPEVIFNNIAPKVISFSTNAEPGYRKAALMVVGCAIEGCSDYLQPRMADFLPLIVNGLQDSHPSVRKAACLALSYIAEELQSEITQYHTSLMPPLFQLTQDNNKLVLKYVWNALDAIVEGMDSEPVQGYLATLIEQIGNVLNSPASSIVKGLALGTLGSAARSSGSAFVPYFPAVIERLAQFMALKPTSADENENFDLLNERAAATDAAGAIADAVGKEIFRPYAVDLLRLALEGLNIPGGKLRDSAFCFYGIMTRVFGAEVAESLPSIMPEIFNSLRQSETDEPLDEGEDDDTDDDEARFEAYSAVAQEKEIVVDVIAEIFENLGNQFIPYVNEVYKELIKATTHFSEGLRRSAISCLLQFVINYYNLGNNGEYIAGLPVQKPVDNNTAAIIAETMSHILQILQEEEERLVVVHICNEILNALDTVGPALIENHLQELCPMLLKLFRREHLCQVQQDDDEDLDAEDPQEVAEQDSLVISGACDLLGRISKVLANSFLPYFPQFYPEIRKFADEKKPSSERATAIATFGELADFTKGSITEFTDDLLQVFQRALTDADPEVRSNAAYGVGTLCANTGKDISSQYPALLQLLSPLFNNQPVPNIVDNACGAVCRMIMARPDAVPLSDVLPVVLRTLPLKADYNENVPVYTCLIQLIRGGHPAIQPHLQEVQSLFDLMLKQNSDQLTPELINQMGQL